MRRIALLILLLLVCVGLPLFRFLSGRGGVSPAEEALLSRARGLVEEGRGDEAVVLYREAVGAFPLSHRARMGLGILLVARPEWGAGSTPLDDALREEGERELREAAALAPDRPEPALQLAIYLRHKGDPESAAWLERAGAIDPGDPSLRMILALLRFEKWVQRASSLLARPGELPPHSLLEDLAREARDPRGDLGSAESLARDALSSRPGDRTARDFLAGCAYQRAETLFAIAEAMRHWTQVDPAAAQTPQRIAEGYAQAAGAFAEASARGAPAATFHRKWCSALEAAGNVDGALERYAEAVRGEGSDRDELRGRYYGLLLREANRALVSDDRDRARRLYRLCLDYLPPDVPRRGIEHHLDVIREADVREALEMDAYYAESFGPEEAAASLDRALSLAPLDARLLRALCDRLARIDDPARLQEALRAWI
ncbi:MAG: hypothetical protein HY608_05065, partial [Planctomycetes bacterium]|nr:hypothetical protein [Planctomycetota bacterium]